MWYTKKIEDVEETLKTSIKYGLGQKEIEKRRSKFGKNRLDEKKK